MREKYSYVAGTAPQINDPGQQEFQKRLVSVHQWISEFFQKLKTDRKALADTAASALKNSVQPKQDNLVAFQKFEKAHLDISDPEIKSLRGDLESLVRDKYKALYPESGASMTDVLKNPRVLIGFKPKPVKGYDVVALVRETASGPQEKIVAGVLYANNARFTPMDVAVQPRGALNKVYVKEGFQHQHYILYERGGKKRFVRRYVVRGLNHDDSYQIENQQVLQAPEQNGEATEFEISTPNHLGKHNLKTGTELTEKQMVLSHTRGWKKRFVSTTTTRRAVYSTRGEQFVSLFGKVIIDLAFVPGESIFDMHTPDSLDTFNTTAQGIHSAPKPGSPNARALATEELLAARDVIRTRELLILREVPYAAIRFFKLSRSVIAIAHHGDAKKASETFDAVEANWGKDHVPTGREQLEFFWYKKIYTFYQFTDDAAANLAWKAVPKQYTKEMFQLNTYDFPKQSPPGFDRIHG